MRVALASDHAGLDLRSAVRAHLEKTAYDVLDLGPHAPDAVDYPDYASRVADAVAGGEADRGVLICGTGIGMSIAANKVRGVRAAVCGCEFTARACRAHNDANILCLGERVLGVGVALSVLDVFLTTPFDGGRHARRVERIADLENVGERKTT